MRSDVTALYVDATGPYPFIVSNWFDEKRDALTFEGPGPVVAHPPCARWGALRNLPRVSKGVDDRHLAVAAAKQVRSYGGVLEHPAWSSLWDHQGMPRPGRFPDAFGGWTLEVDQGRFGHQAPKKTWIYVVGATFEEASAIPRPRIATGRVEALSRKARRLTPIHFAEWLVDLASRCKVERRG